MNPTLSPLKITDFVIINYNFNFEPISNQSVNLSELFESYKIEMDYAVDKQEDYFRIFVKIGINEASTPPIEGYHIFAESITIFKIDFNPSLTIDKKKTEESNYIFNSAIPMAINCLRTYILTATGNAPLGKYILPSINIQDFYRRKESQKKQKQMSKISNSNKVKKTKIKS